MTTPVYEYFDELDISPTMAHTQAGRRGQNEIVTSPGNFQGDPDLIYELETTDNPNVPTTDVQESLDSAALIFKHIKKGAGREFTFSGKEDFTVRFQNRKSKRLNCDCANAAPCSHIYFALNQLTKLNCHRQNIRRSRGALYIEANAERKVILEVDQEDIWPHTILDYVTLNHANDFIRQRTRRASFDQELADMEASLHRPYPQTEFEVDFPDREIHAATMAMLRPVIAKVCMEDKGWARQFRAVLTPVTQAAMRLEELRCVAERELAALTERWLLCSITDERTSHHERQVKRNLEECAYRVYDVYRNLVSEEGSRGADISEATHAAASALICMIGGALKRASTIPPGGASLWNEMTQLDVFMNDPQADPREFWTCTFFTFQIITPDGLTAAQRIELRSISHLAQERTHPHRPGILAGLNAIRRR